MSAMEHAEDELITPAWLNGDFLKIVLRQCENVDDVIVQDFQITPGTVKGDHFGSVIFRAVVNYQLASSEPLKTKSMILKTMPETGEKKDMMQETYLFETEIGMYTEVLPKFEQILSEVGDDTKLKTNCLYHSLSPRKLLVLEDVLPLGYAVLRDRSVTLEEAKVALMKLAKWQAVSTKLLQEQPQFFDKYRHNIWTLPNILEHGFIKDGIEHFADLLRTVPTLNKFLPHFEAIKDRILPESVKAHAEYRVHPKQDTIYVLAHADFHAKNFMFKHNPQSGALEDILLIDFQASYVGPIANDLLYAQYMIWTSEMRAQNADELFGFYVENYNETLKNIGCAGKQLTLAELKIQMRQQKYYEFFLSTSYLPLWNAIRDAVCTPHDLMLSAEVRKKISKDPKFIDELHVILPKFLEMGYFEK